MPISNEEKVDKSFKQLKLALEEKIDYKVNHYVVSSLRSYGLVPENQFLLKN